MTSFQFPGKVPAPAFELYKPDESLTNPKRRTITLKYIEENFAASHVELTPAESQHIRDLVEKASVFGARWPPEHALGLFADTPALEGWKEEKKEIGLIGRVRLDQE
jgi:hypothetical protein